MLHVYSNICFIFFVSFCENQLKNKNVMVKLEAYMTPALQDSEDAFFCDPNISHYTPPPKFFKNNDNSFGKIVLKKQRQLYPNNPGLSEYKGNYFARDLYPNKSRLVRKQRSPEFVPQQIQNCKKQRKPLLSELCGTTVAAVKKCY